MIKRTYFVKVESLPTLRESRRAAGKVTLYTGFIVNRSLFPEPLVAKEFAIQEAAKGGMEPALSALTAMSRI